jgi:site-specific DNA-methyltransferase (adenine-specific)
MASRIEDAGFEIRDMIVWCYGSGFPKSHNVGKSIDKAAGAKRKVVGKSQNFGASNADDGKLAYGDYAGSWDITEPATEDAKKWDGWGTALKPAIEPLTVARKSLEGTVAANVLKHGTGALNIDGCRIDLDADDPLQAGVKHSDRKLDTTNIDSDWGFKAVNREAGLGRWPANFIHDGIETEWAKFFYCPKTSKRDRDEGLDGFEEKEHIFLQTANGTSGKPSSIALDRAIPAYRNTHPTVKPTELMRYLCRLVTPPAGIVLDPFMGSGSTGKAALMEGFKFIGIEMNADYMKIAEARIKAASTPDLFL